jgi:hypothetical protein
MNDVIDRILMLNERLAYDTFRRRNVVVQVSITKMAECHHSASRKGIL